MAHRFVTQARRRQPSSSRPDCASEGKVRLHLAHLARPEPLRHLAGKREHKVCHRRGKPSHRKPSRSHYRFAFHSSLVSHTFSILVVTRRRRCGRLLAGGGARCAFLRRHSEWRSAGTLKMARQSPNNRIDPVIRNIRGITGSPQFPPSIFSIISVVRIAPQPGQQRSWKCKVAKSKPTRLLT
jgi:hypothetical protein